MKKLILAAVSAAIGVFAVSGFTETKPERTGEELFKKHCAVCHVEGGNVLNPEKALHKAQREANGIVSRADIVMKMRHPGKGMTTWPAAILPDEEAEAIAEYILNTFK